ncbi:hypothetical protein ACIBKY_08305 [Nonomuraea sp. NPDC050394]|uniref:hypothetical protein n=1 Tax=Nonomuraea sp. NPDC050394 TaxID=3364363 RepID=UPI0037B62CC6
MKKPLRYLSVAKPFVRVALEDLELGGQTIRAGTTLTLSSTTANRHALGLRGREGGTWPSATDSTSARGGNRPALVSRFPRHGRRARTSTV